MRGTPIAISVSCVTGGIIPAYAGNTAYSMRPKCLIWDHPRVCGEHFYQALGIKNLPGSSPRMRGTLAYRLERQRFPRIIPAYAGNTLAIALWRLRNRDHPRVCGEHASLDVDALSAVGSSPRMRGTLNVNTFVDNQARDHPRVCGEHRTA